MEEPQRFYQNVARWKNFSPVFTSPSDQIRSLANSLPLLLLSSSFPSIQQHSIHLTMRTSLKCLPSTAAWVTLLHGWPVKSLSVGRRDQQTTTTNTMPMDVCLDLENQIPRHFTFDRPSWATAETGSCRPHLEVDDKGECIHHMNLQNECNAFCELSWGWFYGLPQDASVWGYQNWCNRKDPCQISLGRNWVPGVVVHETTGEDRSISSSQGEAKSHTWQNKWSLSKSFSANAGISPKLDPVKLGVEAAKLGAHAASGGTTLVASTAIEGAAQVANTVAGGERKNPNNYGLSVDMTASFSWALSRSKSEEESKSLAHSWGSNIQRSQKYGVTRSTTSQVSLGSSGAFPKPEWASDYCGSWYSVPLVGVSCGRAVLGELIHNSQNQSQCRLDYKTGVLDTCVDYLFEQPNIPDAQRFRMSFVIRDCEGGWTLPGEWQDPAFAASIGTMVEFEKDHLRRFGHGTSWGKKKKKDTKWIAQRRGLGQLNFTKTIGFLEDYNFEYCGRGGYCVRHKLSKGNCYNIPRGFISPAKSAYVVSASVKPGNCCVLFSRHQCQGQPQLVKGNITKLSTVGYKGLAHSVVCNVAEYCDPYYREASDYQGDYPVFIKDSVPWIATFKE
ncbi:hypothetical protein QBC38DRAFT_472871 [Podospora fimiseda]|uniref:Uncharacterized protein n=1 Tax=Podospora fimiseda TaxID=252190 RepID=A0AAN7H658_9PEZI|nr:hypothetical protein QBC38DRAFT_472871 [Podospora fimiseda]